MKNLLTVFILLLLACSISYADLAPTLKARVVLNKNAPEGPLLGATLLVVNTTEENITLLTNTDGYYYRDAGGHNIQIASAIHQRKLFGHGIIPSITSLKLVTIKPGEATVVEAQVSNEFLESLADGDEISVKYVVRDNWSKRFDLWDQKNETVVKIREVSDSNSTQDAASHPTEDDGKIHFFYIANGYSGEVSINGTEVATFRNAAGSQGLLRNKIPLNDDENTITLTVRAIGDAPDRNLDLLLKENSMTVFEHKLFEWKPKNKKQAVGEHQFTFKGRDAQMVTLREKGIPEKGANDPEQIGKALAGAIKTKNYADFLPLVHPEVIKAYKDTPVLSGNNWGKIIGTTQLVEKGSQTEVTVSVSLGNEMAAPPNDDYYWPVRPTGSISITNGPSAYIAQKEGSWFLVYPAKYVWVDHFKSKE